MGTATSMKDKREAAITANRVQGEVYSNTKEILKYDEFVGTVVTVAKEVGQVVGTKLIAKAGTIIGGKDAENGDARPVLLNPGTPVVDKLTGALKASATTEDDAETPADQLLWTAVTAGKAGNNIEIKMELDGGSSVTGAECVASESGDDIIITVTLEKSGTDSVATVDDVFDALETSIETAGVPAAKELVTCVEASTKVRKTDIVPPTAANVPLIGGADPGVAGAEGVLLYDVDVTNGAREGSMVIDGFIDLKKYAPADAALVEDLIDELKEVLPKITFMK